MSETPKPLHFFRIYPDKKGGLWAAVLIWKNRREMYKHNPMDRDHDASCTAYKIVSYKKGEKKARTSQNFCEVNFHAKKLTMNVVSHEFFHAALSYGRRLNLDFKSIASKHEATCSDSEERIAYAHGKMCSDFVYRAQKAGALP